MLLEALCGLPVRGMRHAGVVNQEIKPRVVLAKGRRKSANGGQIAQIERHDYDFARRLECLNPIRGKVGIADIAAVSALTLLIYCERGSRRGLLLRGNDEESSKFDML